MEKFLLLLNGFMLVVYIGLAVFVYNLRQETIAPARDVLGMHVWEDGSYYIKYKNGTTKSGCIRGGLCND